MSIIPKKIPQRSQAEVLKFMLKKYPLVDLARPVMLAVRGYYRDSMGLKLKNDRRVYDDALFCLSPTLFMAFNWNTDPNGFRKGSGFGSKKGMAMLKCGIWDYKPGLHKGRLAFRQAGDVVVTRDGNPPYDHKGDHAINLHDASYSSTSSLGCQTAPPDQFKQMRTTFYAELERYKAKTFKYVLVDEAETGWNI